MSDGSSTRLACQVGNEQASPFFVKGCDHPIDGSMLFSSGTLSRFSTNPTGTLANPSKYCSGHNNLPPLRLPREGKLIIPETFKLFPDISTRSPAMNFIGVDLHKKSITICVMDEKRKILARKTLACTQTDEILEFFRQFRPFKVVVEATASYVWFVELVEPLAEKVVLANPKKLRVIAESTKKTDN